MNNVTTNYNFSMIYIKSNRAFVTTVATLALPFLRHSEVNVTMLPVVGRTLDLKNSRSSSKTKLLKLAKCAALK